MELIESVRMRFSRWLFRRFEQSVAAEPDFARQVELARLTAVFARISGCGYYSSSVIERAFLRRAEQLDGGRLPNFRPGTVLVVMSEAYETGGHTRVVERWIEGDSKRVYSIILIRQKPGSKLPDRLMAAVAKSGGRLATLDRNRPPECCALELRELSSAFEAVLLFVHPDDALPLVAYGTRRFTRPVGLYNHIDHSFWYGVSIADKIGELRQWGAALTSMRRGSPASTVLMIPGEMRTSDRPDGSQARRTLGLDESAHVVLTVGAAYKYRRLRGMDFLQLAVPILKRDPAAIVIAVGMTFEDFPEWKRTSDRFQGRLRCLGKMPHEQFELCLSAADIVVDSRPVPGFTALEDAVSCGVAALTCDGPCGVMDWVSGSTAECRSVEELVDRACTLLSDPAACRRNADDLSRRMLKENSPEAFAKRIDSFVGDLVCAGHRIRRFKPVAVPTDGFDGFLAALGRQELRKVTRHLCRTLYGCRPWQVPLLAFRELRADPLLPYCQVERRLREREGTDEYLQWIGKGRVRTSLWYWMPHGLVQRWLMAKAARKAARGNGASRRSTGVPSSGFEPAKLRPLLDRLSAEQDDSLATDRQARILVCLHLFYPDLWPAVCGYLEHLAPYHWDMVVTYPENQIPAAALTAVTDFKPDAMLLPCRNAGFDIGPFVASLDGIDLSAYDIVFKLQTKGCGRKRIFMYDQLFKREDWFLNLYDGILGGRTVHETVAVLMRGVAGLVAAENLIVRDPSHKREFVRRFCEERGLPFTEDYRFVAGTCFAVQAERLRPLQALGLRLDDFADTVRGEFSLAHALERWMCFAAADGMRGNVVIRNTYPEEARRSRETSVYPLLEDPRFDLDPEFVYRALEFREIGGYEVAEVRLGDIRRVWHDNRLLTLEDCAPYLYLEGDGERYDRYCRENSAMSAFRMSRDRFDRLVKSMENYDPRKMPVVFGMRNIVLDGQHRSCVLLKRFGPDHVIRVVRLFGATKK